jgi:leucyl-tRNA synthetase
MSKSRGNVVNPDDLASRYGSDVVRLFLMFIGPWDQGGPWNPTGIEGIHRFLGRVWAVATAEIGNPMPDIPGFAPLTLAGEIPGSGHTSADLLMATIESGQRGLVRVMQQTIAAVTADYEALHFNTAISKMMEMTTALARARDDGLAGTDAYATAVETLLLLLAPAAPHLAEELWARRGRPYSVHQQPWPVADPALAAVDLIEIPVQVNGKLRDRLQVAPDTGAEEIERLALASERVQALLGGQPPARVIQVPGKLVNVVARR